MIRSYNSWCFSYCDRCRDSIVAALQGTTIMPSNPNGCCDTFNHSHSPSGVPHTVSEYKSLRVYSCYYHKNGVKMWRFTNESRRKILHTV